MANIRIIKRRIKTAKNIAQTTKAMELVAASRMRKAQIMASKGKPYADRLINLTSDLLSKTEISEDLPFYHYFNPSKQENSKILILMLTPDKGLAGSLMSNFFRYFGKFILSEKIDLKSTDFMIVGKKGRDYVMRIGGNLKVQFDMGMIQPKFDKVPPLVKYIDDSYRHNVYNQVFLFYTDFINTLNCQPKYLQLLPLKSKINSVTADNNILIKECLIEPSISTILLSLIPHYLESEIYHALLENYASEQSMRMTAMKNATDNANDIISELTLYYNKARQQVITSEISDIITATLAVS